MIHDPETPEPEPSYAAMWIWWAMSYPIYWLEKVAACWRKVAG